MDAFLADLRRAVRLLRTSPGLLVVSVLSLGLGLGVNFTLFTAIRAVFFYQPTLAGAERVVGVEPGNSNQFSYLNYRDLLESQVFDTAIGYRQVSLNLRVAGDVEPAEGLAVTPNFFEAVQPAMATGASFTAPESAPDRQPRVAVLSHTFWRGRFAADPAIVGRDVLVNGEPYTVVGVLSDRYRAVMVGFDPQVYVPLARLVYPNLDDRGNGNALNVLGWLRPGTTREQARAAVTALGQLLEQRHVENREMGRPASIVPLAAREFGGGTTRLLVSAVLLMLFGLVLLCACANVAGLLLARTASRQREIAVRAALGATRWQLVRMLLTESVAIALAGAAGGAALALLLTRMLEVIAVPGAGVVTLALRPDASLAAYALLLVAVTGLGCGIVPGWRLTGPAVIGTIQRGEGPAMTARLRWRHAFVVAQVAACAILIVVSALLLRSLVRVSSLDPGFDLDGGLVAGVRVNAERYASDGGLSLGRRIVERLDGMAGVRAASLANIVALGTDASAARLYVEGRADASASPRTFLNSVSPRYFETLGVPLLRGRDFDARDRQGAPPVAIVTRAFADAYFPGEDALGKRVRQIETEPYAEIVGIVGDHKYQSYGEPASPIFYAAYAQRPQVSTQIRPLVVHVRTDGPPARLAEDVKRAIAELDPAVAIEVRTFRDAAGAEPALRRLGTLLLGSAGMLALLLSTIGLYGMMAFVVSSGTRELGIRMALGATAGRVVAGVIGRGLTLVAGGIAIGSVVSLAASRAMSGLLVGVGAADPVSFAGTALLLLLVGAAACFVPARRAAHVDPAVVLRRS